MNKGLRSYEELFGNSEGEQEVIQVNIERLVPFKNHPFKLYLGKRLDDMVASIINNGIIIPIIIRQMENVYEILSGHNRVNAAKIAGLEEVPAIVLDDISDDEALMIVTETNFMQRSFSDMMPSEKAQSLKIYYDAIKRQGRRSDLLDGIISSEDSTSSTHDGYRLSLDKIADEYELSRNSIARLLRLNELIPELLNKVDSGRLPMMAAVHLSYLSLEDQEKENNRLEHGKQLSVLEANKKRKAARQSVQREQSKEVSDNKNKIVKNSVTLVSIKLKIPEFLFAKIFKDDQSDKKVNEVVIELLERYSEDI